MPDKVIKELTDDDLVNVTGGKNFMGKDYPEGYAPVAGLPVMNPYEGDSYKRRKVYAVMNCDDSKWAYGTLWYSYEKKVSTVFNTTERRQGIEIEKVSYRLRTLGGTHSDYDWPDVGDVYEFYSDDYTVYIAD